MAELFTLASKVETCGGLEVELITLIKGSHPLLGVVTAADGKQYPMCWNSAGESSHGSKASYLKKMPKRTVLYVAITQRGAVLGPAEQSYSLANTSKDEIHTTINITLEDNQVVNVEPFRNTP